jgi:hypothetical protein
VFGGNWKSASGTGDEMAAIIALGIAVVTVAFVAAPFFLGAARTAGDGAGEGQESEALQELLAEKETVYAAIQELDFDWKSGKLSAEDHQSLRQRYEERAALILQQIDALQAKAETREAPRNVRREKRKG